MIEEAGERRAHLDGHLAELDREPEGRPAAVAPRGRAAR